jgi:peroxiredoxin family protein
MINPKASATGTSRLLRKFDHFSLLDRLTHPISEDMEKMFEKSVRCTYELIFEQLKQAKKSKNVKIKVCSDPVSLRHL